MGFHRRAAGARAYEGRPAQGRRKLGADGRGRGALPRDFRPDRVPGIQRLRLRRVGEEMAPGDRAAATCAGAKGVDGGVRGIGNKGH